MPKSSKIIVFIANDSKIIFNNLRSKCIYY